MDARRDRATLGFVRHEEQKRPIGDSAFIPEDTH